MHINSIINKWEPGTPLIISGLKLKKLPRIPSGVEILDCSYNNIRHIHSLPRSVKELRCQGNMMESIEYIPKNIVKINLSFNCLTNLDLSKCKKLKYINLSWNNFTHVPKLPKSLEYLGICYNNILNIDITESNLIDLDAYNCNSIMVQPLPSSLKNLNCQFNNLMMLPFLPSNLETLNCSHNKLFYIPPLPQRLNYLDCSDNCIFIIPVLPSVLRNFYCDNNSIYELPIFPNSLENFSYMNNPLIRGPLFQADINPDSLYINQYMIIKNYFVKNEIDVIPEHNLGTAFDFINLEDVNINDFLNQDKYNIILLSGDVRYACNRDEIINYLNKQVSEYTKLPWGQKIHYKNGVDLTKLDYLVYKIVNTGHVIPDTVLHKLEPYKISQILNMF